MGEKFKFDTKMQCFSFFNNTFFDSAIESLKKNEYQKAMLALILSITSYPRIQQIKP